MTLAIQFGIPNDITKSLKRPVVNKVDKLLAIVLPDDIVSYKGDIYSIADISKSVRNLLIYYRYDLDNKPIKMMMREKLMGEIHSARPYRTGLTVSGYIDNNQFVITNIVNSHMDYKDDVNKVGLVINN